VIEMSANVSAADIADLNTAIDLMIRNTNRMGKDAVERATYAFLRSGKAHTPKSKGKNRTLHTANDAGEDKWEMKGKRNPRLALVKASRASKFYIVRRQSGQPMRILMPNPDYVKGRRAKQEAREVTTKLKAKYKTKPHRGAAKNSWNRAFNDIGKSVANTMKRRSRRVKMASRAKKLGGTFNPAINVTNDLSYLTKIAPNLEGQAMAAAGKSLLHTVTKGIEAQARKF
jgi:hypothetical protein